MFLNQDIIGILFHFLSDFPFMIFFSRNKGQIRFDDAKMDDSCRGFSDNL